MPNPNQFNLQQHMGLNERGVMSLLKLLTPLFQMTVHFAVVITSFPPCILMTALIASFQPSVKCI